MQIPALILFITIILEANWHLWFFAALAFLYGLAVMMTVIAFLVKTGRESYGRREKKEG